MNKKGYCIGCGGYSFSLNKDNCCLNCKEEIRRGIAPLEGLQQNNYRNKRAKTCSHNWYEHLDPDKTIACIFCGLLKKDFKEDEKE